MEQAEIERSRTKPTENLTAYDLYLRALPHYYAFTSTGNDEALRLLRRAIQLDPDYAVAKAMAGYCIQQRDNQAYNESQTELTQAFYLRGKHWTRDEMIRAYYCSLERCYPI